MDFLTNFQRFLVIFWSSTNTLRWDVWTNVQMPLLRLNIDGCIISLGTCGNISCYKPRKWTLFDFTIQLNMPLKKWFPFAAHRGELKRWALIDFLFRDTVQSPRKLKDAKLKARVKHWRVLRYDNPNNWRKENCLFTLKYYRNSPYTIVRKRSQIFVQTTIFPSFSLQNAQYCKTILPTIHTQRKLPKTSPVFPKLTSSFPPAFTLTERSVLKFQLLKVSFLKCPLWTTISTWPNDRGKISKLVHFKTCGRCWAHGSTYQRSPLSDSFFFSFRWSNRVRSTSLSCCTR